MTAPGSPDPCQFFLLAIIDVVMANLTVKSDWIKNSRRAGEMMQQLRVFNALAVDPSSAPSSHMTAHNRL